MSRYIGLTVDSIKKTHYTTVLNQLVREQVNLIDEQIRSAIERGQNELTFTLPNTFELLSFEKKDAQLALYSEIVSICIEKGFKTQIEIGPIVYLYLTWPGPHLTDRDSDARRKLLRDHSVRLR